MNQELKPCPFCGKHEPVFIEKLDDDNWEICCDNRAGGCGAASTQRLDKGKVITQWNTRAPDISGIIEGMRKAAEIVLAEHIAIDTIKDSIARYNYEQRASSKHLILSAADKLEKEQTK